MKRVRNIALILSGGTVTRLGADIPKQYIEVCGKPVLSYCVECLSAHDEIDEIQIVADFLWQEKITNWLLEADVNSKFRGFSIPGENRQMSIYHGLEDIRAFADDNDNVLIHDAARPLLTRKMISECFHSMIGHDGVLPVLPMRDTVYVSIDGKTITSLLNRNEIFAGQAPEVFRFGVYYEANARLLPDQIRNINGSTEPAIMSKMDIVMIQGDENNFKITTKVDLERFRKIIEDKGVT